MNSEAVAWLDARFDQIEENGFPEIARGLAWLFASPFNVRVFASDRR